MRSLAAAAVAATLLAGCAVHDQDVPPLAGPSEAALSLALTATPDSITQDGASQASIALFARDVNAKPVAGLSIRLDTSVGGSVFDYGTLSAHTVVTGNDGRANVVYTAPPPPPSSVGGSGVELTILATPIGNNFQTASSQMVTIRLVPPGIILPPAETPTAAFKMSGVPASTATSVFFDGSTSCGGPLDANGSCNSSSAITSWVWTFGDGTGSASGRQVSHKFATAATFNVTLTVTNDRGVSASSSETIDIQVTGAPSAKFVISPTNPAAGLPIIFNADQSSAAPGHQIVQFNWNFGDPGSASNTASGFSVTHTYAVAGTYTVVLSVLDDAGQKGTISSTVTVTP